MGWVLAVVLVLVAIVALGLVILFVFTLSPAHGLGAPCTGQQDCDSGYICSANGEAGSVCLGGLGTVCQVNNDCARGLGCSAGHCAYLPTVVSEVSPETLPPPSLEPIQATVINPPVAPSVVHCRPQPYNAPGPRTFAVHSLSSPMVSSDCSAEPRNFDVNSGSTPYGSSPSSYCSRESRACQKDDYEPELFDHHQTGFAPKPNALTSEVIDACSYSSSVLALLRNGDVIQQEGTRRMRISNNVRLSRLECFAGYLYGLSEGTLYQLNGQGYRTKRWSWSRCTWAPLGITHTSATLNGSNLLLQCGNACHLYDAELHLVSKFNLPDCRRVYGTDLDTYLDIYAAGYVVMKPSDQRYQARGGVLTYHNKPVLLQAGEPYAEIRLVNWQPYYLSA